ncbi:helix-turn-helix domain-containing protein [Aliivibrio fischeri]|uniref:helix-turn-helix transcriptional regulator n=1 Tax=Aliivibrio fischeri TaxID=668 RepID=UPI0012D8D621|nr:helix-turn-helix transcriptional regulator [Aliivibrio fischeri]MUK91554.1 helix-turn-helix domain-containing protein [Aliivibrio fischeri]
MLNRNKKIDPIVLYLIQERLRNRMTQKTIAELAGIKLRTYQRIEQGQTEMTINEASRICEIYGITWLDVAYGESDRRHIDTSDISAALKHLSPRLRLATFNFIKVIIEDQQELKRSTR